MPEQRSSLPANGLQLDERTVAWLDSAFPVRGGSSMTPDQRAFNAGQRDVVERLMAEAGYQIKKEYTRVSRFARHPNPPGSAAPAS